MTGKINIMREAGFEAIHVRDIGMHSASDQIIFEYAKKIDLAPNTQIRALGEDVQKGKRALTHKNILPPFCLLSCMIKI